MIARRARLPAVILFIVVAGACGPSGHAGSGDGGELRLHVADSGRSVILHPGERLTLNLGSSLHQHWLIVRYPQDLLARPATSGDDIWFTVLAQGQGRIEAVNTFACPSATAHGCSSPEPGPGAGPSGDQDRVRRTFEVTIRVV